MPADILISDLTNGDTVSGEWVGTGIFDVLMNAVNKNIDIQYDKGRIKGSEYAQVYLSGMQAAIAQSIQYALQEKMQEAQIDKLADGVLTGVKQREVMDAQKDLYVRQKESFDDNKYQKLFEAQLNYNGIVFQDADTPDVLDVALENRVNDVYNKITGNDPTINIAPEV